MQADPAHASQPPPPSKWFRIPTSKRLVYNPSHAMQRWFYGNMTLDTKLNKLTAGLALASALALPSKSEAITPYFDIPDDLSYSFVDEESNLNPGQESVFGYVLKNKGDGIIEAPENDGSAYNLISFILPAGSNNGVFDYNAPVGWNAIISANTTEFTGDYITPNNVDFPTFEILSSNTDLNNTIVGSATATATGNTSTEPFRDYNNGDLSSNEYVSVDVPGAIPEPGNIALLLGLGAGAGALLRRRNRAFAEIQTP